MWQNTGHAVLATPFLLQPSTLFARDEAGAWQRCPTEWVLLCCGLVACKPVDPAVMDKGWVCQCKKQLRGSDQGTHGLGGWRGWPPPHAAFSFGMKKIPKRPQRIQHSMATRGQVPSAECEEISSHWGAKRLAMAATHSCACAHLLPL